MAVFLTPLTLSLGRHLEVYLKKNSPPYLPYAEIVLVSVLWGWIILSILQSYNRKSVPPVERVKSEVEKAVFWIMMVWAALAILGVYPALYRNIITSPPIPVGVFVIKLAFAPVWGWADEFFPITMTLRTFLACCFLFYTQRHIRSERDIRAIIYAFSGAMAIAVGYAIIQALFSVGYSKWGDPTHYVQSTFHENESFAAFCLVGLVILLTWECRQRSHLANACLWSLKCLFIFGVILSASRAIMFLGLAAILFFTMTSSTSRCLHSDNKAMRWKHTVYLLLLIPLLSLASVSVSPRVGHKVRLLFDEIRQVDFQSGQYGHSGLGNQDVSLVGRVRLWQSGLRMLADSWGVPAWIPVRITALRDSLDTTP